MAKKPNKETCMLMAKMVEDGCIICERPAEIHHLTGDSGLGQKSKRFFPLCSDHHRNGGHGNAIHSGVETWEGIFGTQWELYEKTLERLGLI